MGELAAVTLWTDTKGTRFFLVPDGPGLPGGAFTIRTATGRRQSVDPGSVAAFEVCRQVAEEWTKTEFGNILDLARTAADRLIENIRERTARIREGGRSDEPRG